MTTYYFPSTDGAAEFLSTSGSDAGTANFVGNYQSPANSYTVITSVSGTNPQEFTVTTGYTGPGTGTTFTTYMTPYADANHSETYAPSVPIGNGATASAYLILTNSTVPSNYSYSFSGPSSTFVPTGGTTTDPTRAVKSDFNADRTSDLLLQSGSTVVDWLLKASVFQSGNAITLGSGSTVLGSGDFNGDRTADILLKSGTSLIDYAIDDGKYQAGYNIGNAGANVVKGTGDVNDDGTDDIILQNGNVVIDWIMKNGKFQAQNTISNNSGGAQVVGIGDFNGDGTDDILLQNGNTIVDWIMRNGHYELGHTITTNAGGATVVGTGDFNGDGTTDILLQKGSALIDWTLENGVYQAGHMLGSIASGFHVAATGDYNGDGTTDIAFQNGSAAVTDWTIQNSHVTGTHTISANAGAMVIKS